MAKKVQAVITLQIEAGKASPAPPIGPALASYGIDAKVVDVERGPRVTRYEIQLPPGVRVSRVTNLADDLAYALSALAVRVEAPVPAVKRARLSGP